MADTHAGNPFDYDSDDEDGSKASTAKRTEDEYDPYGPGCLCCKTGRGENMHLYYVNYNKIREMSHDERQKLYSDQAIANAEKERMQSLIKSNIAEATKLNSQPTNYEMIPLEKNLEEEVASLQQGVEESRLLKVNEQSRIGTKRKIQSMTAHWTQRKRLCNDFVTMLEDVSEGSISRAKAYSGDGPFTLESDEDVAKAEVRAATRKNQRKKGNKLDLSDPNFVAVCLGKGNLVERVYANVESKEN